MPLAMSLTISFQMIFSFMMVPSSILRAFVFSPRFKIRVSLQRSRYSLLPSGARTKLLRSRGETRDLLVATSDVAVIFSAGRLPFTRVTVQQELDKIA